METYRVMSHELHKLQVIFFIELYQILYKLNFLIYGWYLYC